MDSGLAAVFGAAIGVFGTLGTTWLNHHFAQEKPNPAEKAAKELLENLLNRPKWRWRRLDTLANVVGTDEATVRRLLLEIGARGSMTDGRLWGLVSRNPVADQSGGPAHDPVILELGPGEPPEDEEETGF